VSFSPSEYVKHFRIQVLVKYSSETSRKETIREKKGRNRQEIVEKEEKGESEKEIDEITNFLRNLQLSKSISICAR
jgi:hypothetical protein